MLDGITVLDTVQSYNKLALICLIVVAAIGLAVFILSLIEIIANRKTPKNIIIIKIESLCISILFMLLGVCGTIKIITNSDTRYKVTVSDSVSFNDVMDNYEIISRDGDIYTIEKINTEEEP